MIFNIFKRKHKESWNENCNKITYPDIDFLVCKEENTLTVTQTTYKHYDMYFVRDDKVMAILDEIYVRNNHEVDLAYESCNHAIRPDSYFKVADILGLKTDKLSFIYLTCMWCANNDEDLPSVSKYKPDTLPTGWDTIYNEADEFYKRNFEVECKED